MSIDKSYGDIAGIINAILADENPFEKQSLENVIDKKLLYYSCLVDEQNKQALPVAERETFWKEELIGGAGYRDLVSRMEKYSEFNYPSGFALENNTICNAHCTNCTHEELIRNGKRPSVNVSLRDMRYRIRKLKLIGLLLNEDGQSSIDLTGFGEPFLNPDILDAVEYATHYFDKVVLTSNGSLLTEEWYERYFSLPTTCLNLSLSYFDAEIYEKEIGIPYKRTIDSIKLAFEVRDRLHSRTKITVHIFDNRLNSQDDQKAFKEYFAPYKREGDLVYTRDYDESTDNGIETRNNKRFNLKPCFMLWTGMIVDVSGDMFPCCHCGWISDDDDDEMCIGRIEDEPESLLKNVREIRRRHREGQYGQVCLACAILHEDHPGDYTGVLMPDDMRVFFKTHKKVFLYGAGDVGAKILRLISENQYKVEGFIESQKKRENYLGKEIIEAGEFDYEQGTGIVIAIGKGRRTFEIENILKNKGYKDTDYFIQSIYS